MSGECGTAMPGRLFRADIDVNQLAGIAIRLAFIVHVAILLRVSGPDSSSEHDAEGVPEVRRMIIAPC